MPATHNFNPSLCPLCQRPNTCAVAAGKDAQHCWCWNTVIDPQALEKVPPEASGRFCICAHCANNKGDETLER